ncbi:hypothetical protein [Ferruginibacter sp. SUN106]|uniref:hypothetical protein n=1 Tax=Ferruginibacter sp. SUN106 TaxID=2978348 RepID=UPI003D359DD1
MIIAIVLTCFSFCTQDIFAQSPSVKTVVDKNDILIGEPIQYKVTSTFPSGVYKVSGIILPDSVAHFDIVEKGKIDTSIQDNTTTLQQTITLTSFDSGRWNIPAFKINFDPVKDDTTIFLSTDSIAVNVGYAPADSTSQLRDIKPIMEVEIKSYLWYYIGGGIILLVIIGFLIWKYVIKKAKTDTTDFTAKLSPYDEAIQNLDKLKQLNLQNPEDIKQYHAKLSSIFKWYISRRQKLSIMNKTTGDVLVQLAENNLPKDTLTNAATALRCGDAVKFAKYLPVTSESEECFNKIKATIHFIHSSKPLNT